MLFNVVSVLFVIVCCMLFGVVFDCCVLIVVRRWLLVVVCDVLFYRYVLVVCGLFCVVGCSLRLLFLSRRVWLLLGVVSIRCTGCVVCSLRVV